MTAPAVERLVPGRLPIPPEILPVPVVTVTTVCDLCGDRRPRLVMAPPGPLTLPCPRRGCRGRIAIEQETAQ